MRWEGKETNMGMHKTDYNRVYRVHNHRSLPPLSEVLLLLLRRVVHVDLCVDLTQYVRFLIRLDEQRVIAQRADDEALTAHCFLVLLLQKHFRDHVALNDDALCARKDRH